MANGNVKIGIAVREMPINTTRKRLELLATSDSTMNFPSCLQKGESDLLTKNEDYVP